MEKIQLATVKWDFLLNYSRDLRKQADPFQPGFNSVIFLQTKRDEKFKRSLNNAEMRFII